MSNDAPHADAARQKAREIIERFLQCLLEKDIDGWAELWDEHGAIEFPFGPPGYPRRVEGKAALHAYMKNFPEQLEIKAFSGVKLYPTLDPEVTILEFACEGRAIATGRPYNQSYIAVVETRGGKLTLYRDYWNPMVALEAMGTMDSFIQAASRAAAPAAAEA